MNTSQRRKACKALLKSEVFRDANYAAKCEERYGGNAAGHVDHILDLETVATVFSRHFGDKTLNQALAVMCVLNPVLNGKHNLCRISEDLNTKKRVTATRRSAAVKNYLLDGDVIRQVQRLFGALTALTQGGVPALPNEFLTDLSAEFSERHGFNFPNYPNHPGAF